MLFCFYYFHCASLFQYVCWLHMYICHCAVLCMYVGVCVVHNVCVPLCSSSWWIIALSLSCDQVQRSKFFWLFFTWACLTHGLSIKESLSSSLCIIRTVAGSTIYVMYIIYVGLETELHLIVSFNVLCTYVYTYMYR